VRPAAHPGDAQPVSSVNARSQKIALFIGGNYPTSIADSEERGSPSRTPKAFASGAVV